MKLMSGFCRSIAAANSFPATLQCIFGCMYGMLANICHTCRTGLSSGKIFCDHGLYLSNIYCLFINSVI